VFATASTHAVAIPLVVDTFDRVLRQWIHAPTILAVSGILEHVTLPVLQRRVPSIGSSA
jgi:hypothetical protein